MSGTDEVDWLFALRFTGDFLRLPTGAHWKCTRSAYWIIALSADVATCGECRCLAAADRVRWDRGGCASSVCLRRMIIRFRSISKI